MSEHLLMVTRQSDTELPESEPVLLEQKDNAVVLHLDDGEDLSFDADELRRVLDS